VRPRGPGLTEKDTDMSLDRSLKTGGSLSQKRSVLKRTERIAKMIEDKRLDAKNPKALGLPKTLVPRVKA